MKRRNLFMSLTIMLGMFTVAFNFNDEQFTWFWTDNKPIAIILGITTIITGILWIKYQRRLKFENKS
jgi:hypothetical protein